MKRLGNTQSGRWLSGSDYKLEKKKGGDAPPGSMDHVLHGPRWALQDISIRHKMKCCRVINTFSSCGADIHIAPRAGEMSRSPLTEQKPHH
ncbi:hypothetical protein EYF80_052458 [Liparis tanakae]|uniref:Uncharacterized protein n=1 Tax=Liparis tanakae TaxID=230148 RepID=A0A4Z2F922_9TELE|nr:hypothetical protein EYF80_052458 [Liparis tanakae]